MRTCSEEILSILTSNSIFVAHICLCTTLQFVFNSGVCQGAPLATLHMLTDVTLAQKSQEEQQNEPRKSQPQRVFLFHQIQSK